MVSTLFTALALIATGQVKLPPAPPAPIIVPQDPSVGSGRKSERR